VSRDAGDLGYPADVQLNVRPFDADQGIELVGLAPLEPPPKLAGVQRVRVAGVPGQIGDRRQLGTRYRVRLEWQQKAV
jgi:hypothetical protein